MGSLYFFAEFYVGRREHMGEEDEMPEDIAPNPRGEGKLSRCRQAGDVL